MGTLCTGSSYGSNDLAEWFGVVLDEVWLLLLEMLTGHYSSSMHKVPICNTSNQAQHQ
jgi:hypothetical protein